ncbi:MAG: ADP-ribosylglycohydrolase family protein [Gammaproteobacteria bacterium]|nr:ADP-ribosylglycohydrolase family protein [Gammaproteobacteria bacterium]
MSEPRQDQVTGALIGCAVGDALGAPIEGWSRERIAPLDGLTAGYRPLVHGRAPNQKRYPLGQYTDDTQLTLAIARSLVAQGRVDGAAIAREFAALWESGEIVGAGPVADRAVRRLIAGAHWQEAAIADDLALNGAAMRIAAIGLWDCDDRASLADDATVASIVTHKHPLAIDAAIAVATAVAGAVANTVDTASFLHGVAQAIETRSPEFGEHIRQVRAWLELPEDDALQAIASTGGGRIRDGFGIPALAEPTVLAALYAFLKSPTDYTATIDITLRIGGDVDTIAAIAGAISGAHNGLAAIPTDLVKGVKDSGEILDLGRRLFDTRFG